MKWYEFAMLFNFIIFAFICELVALAHGSWHVAGISLALMLACLMRIEIGLKKSRKLQL